MSDLEWLSEVVSDTKQRADSLRQLSYLFGHTGLWWLAGVSQVNV